MLEYRVVVAIRITPLLHHSIAEIAAAGAEFGRHAGRRMDDSCTNLRIEATKPAFESEPNL